MTDIASRKVKMEGFLSKLAEHLSPEESGVIEAYINSLQNDRVEAVNVLLHGDLHFKNMLVNENGIVSGIIDWGDLSVGHPACDLSVAYSFLPPYARGVFFETYGGADEDTKLLARLIAVYIPMLILMQAVDDGNEAIAAEAKSILCGHCRIRLIIWLRLCGYGARASGTIWLFKGRDPVRSAFSLKRLCPPF